jgi:hypothetical protein
MGPCWSALSTIAGLAFVLITMAGMKLRGPEPT